MNEGGKKYVCLATKLNVCLVMLDIVVIFMLICHVYYCHRGYEQFRGHVDVNYGYVNFVMRCIIQKNQNTKMFLMRYNKCDYYFARCASL